MKDQNAIKKKILEEEDFIYCPRLGNSLERMVAKNPDGIDEDRLEKVLMLSTEEIQAHYQSAIVKLRKALGVKNA